MSELFANATNGLALLLDVMPERVRDALVEHPQHDVIIEIVLDLGRLPEARFPDHMEELSAIQVSRDDIAKNYFRSHIY